MTNLDKTRSMYRKMIRSILFMGLGLFTGLPVFGQVLIAPSPGTPHSSSMLEIKSTNKALLIPRLTLANRPAGTSGLMYYQTDNTPGFYYYNNGTWRLNNFAAQDYWLLSAPNLYNTSNDIALGASDASANRLFAVKYQGGKSAVVGSEESSGTVYSVGMLGTLYPHTLGVPIGSSPLLGGLSINFYNAAVTGIKPNQGNTGAGIIGWNNDDNYINTAGYFYSDGRSSSGEYNFGIISVADSSSGSNYAGYFKGRMLIEGHTGAGAIDSAATLVRAVVNHNYTYDTKALEVESNPAPGYGIGIETTAGFRGLIANADGQDYVGHVYGVTATATGTEGYRYGLYGVASGTGAYNYGVIGLSNAAATYNFGVKGETAGSGSYNYAFYGYSHSTGTTNYGVYSQVNSAATNYGIYSYVSGAATNNYGVYSNVSGGTSNNWAGYFVGALYGSKTLNIGTSNTSYADAIIVGQTTLGKMIIAPSSSGNDSAMIYLSEANSPAYGMGWMYDGFGNKMKLFTDGSIATADYDHMVIQRDGGEIAINTETFANGYQLSVNGKVICTEVRVAALASWPDYVFANDYELMPLSQLEEQISREKHLPNVPSASEVESEGIELGQMNKILLEKVEELTLYVIQLNKQLEEQEQRINELETPKTK